MTKIYKFFLLAFVLVISNCAIFNSPPSGKVILKRTSFDKLKGWEKDNINDFIAPFSKSCFKIKENKYKKYIDNSKIKISTEEYIKICNEFEKIKKDDVSLRLFIRQNFAPYKVSINNNDKGVFTGYYEAELNGSFEKTAKYNVPIYGLPDDIIEVNPSLLEKDCCNKRLIGRVSNKNKVIKYYSRKQILENKDFSAPVLLWVDSAVEAFILHIQGSGRVNMPDGSVVRLGYAGNNGHKFVGIGSLMMERKLNDDNGYSMPEIKKWLVKYPKKAKEIMNENPRFIFFRIIKGDGPIGAQGVALTPLRSIAVDRKYIPLGLPLWIDTKNPDGKNIRKIVLAQDMGAAIKGAIRADYFWGFGQDAFNMAGRMKSSGKYYIFLPIKK